MVSTQKRKPVKSSKGKARRVAVQIRTHIPFNKNEVVTHTKVARKVNKRIVTQSKNVIVPIPPSAPSEQLDPSSSTRDASPKPTKQARKGPSRSTAVTIAPSIYNDRFSSIFRRTSNTGFRLKMSFPTRSSNLKRCTSETSPPPVRLAAPATPRSGASTVSLPACFVRVASFTSTQTSSSTNLRYDRTISPPRATPKIYISQRWNGTFFDDTSLFELGATYQLGHDVDDICPVPSSRTNLTLLDISGVYKIQITYCFCGDGGVDPATRRCQLLRARLFPATWARPGTVFTFRLLDFLHKLQTQSKVNLYDFYNSLISIDNPAGQRPPVVRLFLSTIHMANVRHSDSVSLQ